MTRQSKTWFALGWDTWSLGVEASVVMGLRTLKIASGGPAADAEARRMVTEKVDAAMALQTMALTGGLGLNAPDAADRTLSHYRRAVRANHRRLAKG